MKIVKKILSLLIILLLVTGCSVKYDDKEKTVYSDEKIKLNVSQADLIASVTDNEKYLNKDLVQKIDVLEDSDTVNIIVTLDANGLADSYVENNKGYTSLSEYVDSKTVNSSIKDMEKEQEEIISLLLEKNYINEVKHTYNTLFNGFSAKTTYGQFKKLQKAGLDIDVSISEVYAKQETETKSFDSYEAVVNHVKVYGTGIFDSSGVKYDGENTAVAILDSGFDIHHTVFKNMPATPMISMSDVQNKLYETKAYNYTKNIKVQDVYVNSKIPFAFDYADKDSDVAPYDSNHGTHVAGIIGGSDEVITGVAVNTQLVLMKVFGDINNGAIQDDILAALEDAFLLEVDAINLSLGTACGFATSKDDERINEVYDKIEAAGISLIVAASNDYSSGYGGENSNTNKASNPDSATVGSPGTYKSTFSIASISGVKSKYIIDETGYTFFFNNANDSAGEPYDFYDMLFEKLETNRKVINLEYVTVPGVGKKVNYSNIDVEGKIALVKRGDTSFEEKAQVALSEGAIGCIIYNNIAGEVFMNAGTGLEIALCSISKDDGEYLAAKGTGTLTFDLSYLAGPFMSDFSSWGPVSDLSLKPEITAHGGSILSSVPGGGYEEISGTSMACPNLCGVVILIRQALKERYENITAVELNNMTNKLLMSTGTIILDEQGNPYSPRKQGAGLGNLEYALDSLAYLSVEGSTKSKLELKDDPEEKGVYTLKFDINNISNKVLTYRLDNYTMTESLSTSDPTYVAEKAYMLNPNTTASVSGDGKIDDNNVITVNPNGVVTVTYTLSLTASEKKYIQESFINGIYVEGFAVLDSMNSDNIDLSIPFLAFFGDWTVAPMFDKTYYEVESEAHNGAIDEEDKLKADYYATTPMGTLYYSYIVPLGSYVYDMDESKYDPIPATEEHAAISYTFEAINGITTVYAGLLRNARKMTTTIVNKDTGEVVYDHVKYDEHKAYFSGQIVPGYDLINVTAVDLGLQNNTQYTFSMQAELDYDDGGLSDNLNNTFEFSFYVDYEAPIIKDAEFYTKYDKTNKEYKYYVDVYVYDNHYAQSIRPFTIVNGELTSLSEYVIPIYSEKGSISKVTVEITDYIDILQFGITEDGTVSIGNGLGFLVDDYALNQSYQYVTLPGTNNNSIYYAEDSDIELDTKDQYTSYYYYKKKMAIGQTLDLATLLRSSETNVSEEDEVQTSYFENLQWKSSDENIIKVNRGKIETVAEGTAYITCTSMNSDGYPYSLELKINVSNRESSEEETNKLNDLEFLYFDTLKAFKDGPEISEIGEPGQRFFFTEKSVISCYPSEQIQIGYKLDPWNLKNYELMWSSTNDKVATVDDKGVVTALKEGSATISLKVKVGNRVSSIVASTRVSVKSEFVIEGNVLTAYKGFGGDVVIPDDEGILYIGAFAFSLYTTDYNVKIEEDDYDAAKTPASNDTVTSVVIPANVQEVRKYAFYNCTALEKVTFLSDDENNSCPIIREYAFANNKNLKEINLNNVEILGQRAFYNCESLETIDTSNIYAMGVRVFENCIKLSYVDITSLRNAGKEIFLNCFSLEKFDSGIFSNFSEGMFKNSGLKEVKFYADRIPNDCFENCDSLLNVEIFNTLVYVGQRAFANSLYLDSVMFTDNAGAEFIYQSAFENCKSLKTVVLPNSEFQLEEYAFNNCVLLETVVFNKNTKIINNLGSAFNNCKSLSNFEVDVKNNYYESVENLLLNNDRTVIILAAPNYNYGVYSLPSNIKEISESAFSNITTITELIINNNVIIGKSAFLDCYNLTTVRLLSDNIIIKDSAFMGCSNLVTVENMDRITEFAPYVFANTNLNEVFVNNATIGEGSFFGINGLTKVEVVTDKISDFAFAYNKSLMTASITANEVGKNAFVYCNSLSNLELNNVELINDNAFTGCISLTTAISDTVLVIGDYAFADCLELSTIKFDSLKEIGNYAFSTMGSNYANKLVEVIFTDSLESIGDYAFYNSNLLEVVETGSGLKYIGAYAFGLCQKLIVIATDGVVERISECAFYEATNLKSVQIPGIRFVENAAFYSCLNLVDIDLSNVIYIGMQAFNNCSVLGEVDLSNVIYLGDGAFWNATQLTISNMPKVEYFGTQCISGTSVTEIIIPNTVYHIAPAAFANNPLLTTFKDELLNDTGVINEYALLDKGVLYTVTDNNKYLLSSYPTAKQDSEYEVIFGTVRIEEYAGYINNYIRKLILPDTLKLIGNMCFNECSRLKEIEFKSTKAPTLEGTVSALNLSYSEDSEIYKLLNKYFQFNGYTPLFYGQFKDMVGVSDKINISIPSNADVESYQTVLYNLYFNLYDYNNEINKTDYVALDHYSIDYLDKASSIPSKVSLNDEKIIVDARTAYNLVSQDLTAFYSNEYIDTLYENLVNAEKEWLKLKNNRVNKIYKFLIEDIKDLGSEYQFDKLSSYHDIVEKLDRIDDNDKKYLDTSNVDGFKTTLDEYFKNLNEEVDSLETVGTLPTTTVNKVGLTIVLASTGVVTGLVLIGVILKRRFF